MADDTPLLRRSKEVSPNPSPKAIHPAIVCTDPEGLQKMLGELSAQYKQVNTLRTQLPESIVRDYLAGNIAYWEQQLLISMEIINGIKEDHLRYMDEHVRITYYTNTTLKQLETDAWTLLGYLDIGNSLSALPLLLKKPFLPKKIRKTLYLRRKLVVNDQPCTSSENLLAVLQDLALKRKFRKLSKIWDREYSLGDSYAHQFIFGSSYAHKYTFFKNLLFKFMDLVTHIEAAEQLREKIQKMANLRVKAFTEECFVVRTNKKIPVQKMQDRQHPDSTVYNFSDIMDHLAHITSGKTD
ncbi:hypothetical protein [Eudoraea algarum]|uniref:hypothetical protein n=1 Tax=Eudoraea algarum TaxID=3417568 RepID=UPI003F5D5118